MGVGLDGFEFLEERERGEIGSAKKRKKNLLPLSLRHSKRKKIIHRAVQNSIILGFFFLINST
jgi:hypothetical protein